MSDAQALVSKTPADVKVDESILSAAKGGGITFVGTILEYVGRFAIGILLGRLLGSDQYGLYSLADSAIYMIIGLALLGLDTALMHYVPIYVTRKDKRALWGTLQVGMRFPTLLGVVGGICLFVFATPIAEHIFHEPNLVPLLRVGALAAPFGALGSAAVAATRGFKKMQYKVIAQDIVQTSVKLILTVFFALTGLNALKAVTAYTVAMIVTSILLLYFVNQLFARNRVQEPWLPHSRRMLKFSLPVYMSRLIGMFGPNLRTLMLGMFGAIVSVGVFTAAMRIRMVGLAFQQAVVVMSMPIVSDLYGKKDKRQLGRFYQTMTKWTLTFNLPIFLIIILFPETLLSVFGQDFVSGALALIILACGDLVNAATGICGVMVTMSGKAWLNTLNSLVSLLVNVVLSILLIPKMGIVGAAIAAGLAVVVSNLTQLVEFFVLDRLLPYDKTFIKPVVAGVSAAIAGYGLLRLSVADMLIVKLAIMGVLCTLYAGLILLLGLSEEDQVVLQHFYKRLMQYPGLNKLLTRRPS